MDSAQPVVQNVRRSERILKKRRKEDLGMGLTLGNKKQKVDNGNNDVTQTTKDDQREVVIVFERVNKVNLIQTTVQDRQVRQNYVCRNEAYGCPAKLTSIAEKTGHLKKCLYSILDQCKHPQCIANGLRPFTCLEDLIMHAIDTHGCIELIKEQHAVNGETKMEVNFENAFLHPNEDDFSAKVIANYDETVDGSVFHIAFFVIVTGERNGGMYILPVLYGDSNQLQYFVRLDLALMDSTGRKLCAINDFPHRSHNIGERIITRALACGKLVFEALEKNYVVKIDKNEIVEHVDFKFVLSFKTLAYSCEIEDNNPTLPYLLKEEEIEIEGDFKDSLGLDRGVQNMAILGTVLPYIRKGKDIQIECGDISQTIRTLLVSSLEIQELFGQFQVDPAAVRGPRYLILLPRPFMFASLKSSIQDMAAKARLVCKFFTNAEDDEMIDAFIANGSDIVVTTPPILQQLNAIPEVSQLIFQQLFFLVVPNSDYLLNEESAAALHSCILNFPNGVFHSLLKVAIAPLLNENQKEVLNICFFCEEEHVTIQLGPKFPYVFENLPIFQLQENSFVDKVACIKQIINVHDIKEKWLILSSKETESNYDAKIDFLTDALARAYRDKKIIRYDKEETIDESCFNPIKTTDGIIVISSYFALHYDSIKSVGGIILLKLSKLPSELMRLLPMVETLRKPIYWVRSSQYKSGKISIASRYGY